ncbi:putative transcription factor AS2-LOB family [Helianthus annuus]|nr:putative transcription factor AS2-LOB family [Helianthus annuus]
MAPGHSPCASCKLLRRRCAKDCIFAPYFPSNDPHKFAIVHKVFGASNVSKMLQELEVHQRGDAVSSLVYEANARMRDPVYGCVGAISYLQNEVSQLQTQLAMAQAEILCIQMQQEPLVPSPTLAASVLNSLVPVQYPTRTTDDVVSRVSSDDDVTYPCLHNMTTNHHHHHNDQHFNFISSSVIQYENVKRESSSLWA